MSGHFSQKTNDAVMFNNSSVLVLLLTSFCNDTDDVLTRKIFAND